MITFSGVRSTDFEGYKHGTNVNKKVSPRIMNKWDFTFQPDVLEDVQRADSVE